MSESETTYPQKVELKLGELNLAKAVEIINEGMAQNKHLKNLLDGRDLFIVSKGLWGEFVKQLPVAKP